MDWNSIITDVVSGTLLLVFGGIGGWIAGISKGKKKSELAIERKNEIYQPIIDELIDYTNFNWDIMTEIKAPKLFEIVSNCYKYGLSEELLKKCESLNNSIKVYSNINIISVSHNIIVKIFKEAYEEIYGSIIEGVCYHSDRDGNEWNEEVIAAPVEYLEQFDCPEQIRNLLINEGMYSDQVCIDYENSLYEPIYKQLKDIYASFLYIHINGEQYKLPECKIKLRMLPEEHMAYYYDFFERFNQNEDIQKKYKIREDIIYSSQGIVQDLKDIVERIVKIYEVEQI
ncbi:MAG: hypothetical protein VB018_05585 [Lachnospiraceae bacterium]|nr:hypothetical protein [Lachnospiraceae bacterium]